MVVSRRILRKRNVSDRSFGENKNTFYLEEYGRASQASDANIIMHFPCWITKATHTSSEYVIQQQQHLCEHTSVLSYTYIACLVLSLKYFQIDHMVQGQGI
jgi:hypothetical protein